MWYSNYAFISILNINYKKLKKILKSLLYLIINKLYIMDKINKILHIIRLLKENNFYT